MFIDAENRTNLNAKRVRGSEDWNLGIGNIEKTIGRVEWKSGYPEKLIGEEDFIIIFGIRSTQGWFEGERKRSEIFEEGNLEIWREIEGCAAELEGDCEEECCGGYWW